MKETSFDSVTLPVFFFDGICESNIGNVVVSPSLDFNQFQSIIAQKIGIPLHQFFIYLSSHDTRRKIPITGKINFGAISRNKSCFFLVVLKRSRRDRRQKNEYNNIKKTHHGFPENDLFSSSMEAQKGRKKNDPVEKVMILRRGMGFDFNEDNSWALEDRIKFEKRLRNLQAERERYLMSIDSGLNGLVPNKNAENKTVGVRECEVKFVSGNMVICKECLRAELMGTDPEFHCCVNDDVIFRFKSNAGPIARPVKKSD